MLHIIMGKYNDRLDLMEKEILNNRTESDETIRIDKKDFSEYSIPLLATETSMFGDKKLFIFSEILGTEFTRDEALDSAKSMVESSNIFIIHEDKTLKPILTKFEKAGASIHKIEKIENKKRVAYDDEPFNLFTLTDALGKRDKKKLWLIFTEAVYKGAPIEEIHGLLNWQIKNMIMVSATKENPGMHPFAYKKTVEFARNYSPKELKELSSKMVSIFHNRETGISLESKMDEFILGL